MFHILFILFMYYTLYSSTALAQHIVISDLSKLTISNDTTHTFTPHSSSFNLFHLSLVFIIIISLAALLLFIILCVFICRKIMIYHQTTLGYEHANSPDTIPFAMDLNGDNPPPPPNPQFGHSLPFIAGSTDTPPPHPNHLTLPHSQMPDSFSSTGDVQSHLQNDSAPPHAQQAPSTRSRPGPIRRILNILHKPHTPSPTASLVRHTDTHTHQAQASDPEFSISRIIIPPLPLNQLNDSDTDRDALYEPSSESLSLPDVPDGF